MYLNIQFKTDVIASFDLNQIEGTIGSSDNAQIVLKNSSVFPEHAKLTRVKKGMMITPFSEKAEVYVNAQLIKTPHILSENNIINIGSYSLIVQCERENVTGKQFLFIPFIDHKFAKVLVSLIAVIGVITVIVLGLSKMSLNYGEDTGTTLEKAKQMVYSSNDLKRAKKLLEKIIRSNGSNSEAKELLQDVRRRIRVKDAVDDAVKVLNSRSLTGYNESVTTLSEIFDELTVVGLDPSNQIKIRGVLHDLETKKSENK